MEIDLIKNERDAWLFLANCWDKAVPDTEDYYLRMLNLPVYAASVGRGKHIGLCSSLDAFHGRANHLSRDLEVRLWVNQPYLAKKINTSYWWSLGRWGAKRRAAFCRKMAKLASEE